MKRTTPLDPGVIFCEETTPLDPGMKYCEETTPLDPGVEYCEENYTPGSWGGEKTEKRGAISIQIQE